MIIDATNSILGRLSAKIAKEVLKGQPVTVVNTEKIVISGNPEAVIARFKAKRDRKDPHKGPFFPRYPDRILKRTVRGMLPYKTDRGAKALRMLKVEIGNPNSLKGETLGKTADDLSFKYITLEEVCKKLGAKFD
ncbi:MAG: 50S ribosomal protein L13 [Candidatus Aenigmarchaeota archaeon]|nr:50S ribosomal protein L13 [Candidatus Aenigmarchaeota archaeon]